MKIRHSTAIFLSGALWFLAGVSLLFKGLGLLAGSTRSLDQAADFPLLLIAGGLAIGFIKGRYVLSKTVKRVVERIRSFSNPLSLTQIYAPSYCLLILSMVGLGLSLKWLPCPVLVRGVVDVAIGSALMNGALLYFRSMGKTAKT